MAGVSIGRYWSAVLEAVKALEFLQISGVTDVLSEETKKSVQKALDGLCTETCEMIGKN